VYSVLSCSFILVERASRRSGYEPTARMPCERMSDLLWSIEGRRARNIKKSIATESICRQPERKRQIEGKAHEGGKKSNEEGLDSNLLLSSRGVEGEKRPWSMVERAGDETGVARVEEEGVG